MSLELSADGTNLTDYISTVDACFREFNLPGFYQVWYASHDFSSFVLYIEVFGFVLRTV